MASRLRFGALSVAVATLVLSANCSLRRLERELVAPRQLITTNAESPYLKAHLKNGFVYVLSDWHADSAAAVIVGTGQLLDINRAVVDTGRFRVPFDSVALFETNVLHGSGATIALTVMAGITAGVAAVCLTNTKACFGSCPTFYIEGSTQLAAEGFSASIAPALEATDLDMLARARPRGRDFTLRLTNEALETHVIRWADVIVAPRPSGGRVFVTPDGRFLNATALTAPSRCTAAEGDCLAAVARLDGQERSTTADSTDLATRETIELEAVVPDSGDWGVVMTARQSLLTTFLIYQSLAYMGQDAGRFLAALGTMGPSARAQAAGLGRTLGRIDVLVPDDSGWIVAGSVGETGPLAADTKIVPLPMRRGGAQAQKIRLRMTKGLWRIDYVALARLGKPVATQRLQPARVRRDGRDDPAAWRALRDSALVLATLPGDVYQLTYRLPPHPERYEIFLEARGYYLEWMRREWFAEQNSGLALGLFLDPAASLRRLAPAYKQVEPDIERLFWSSRYAKP